MLGKRDIGPALVHENESLRLEAIYVLSRQAPRSTSSRSEASNILQGEGVALGVAGRVSHNAGDTGI